MLELVEDVLILVEIELDVLEVEVVILTVVLVLEDVLDVLILVLVLAEVELVEVVVASGPMLKLSIDAVLTPMSAVVVTLRFTILLVVENGAEVEVKFVQLTPSADVSQ